MIKNEADIEALAATVKTKREKVRDYRIGFHRGALTYDDLRDAGRELSDALFDYARARFPDVKPKRISYHQLIR